MSTDNFGSLGAGFFIKTYDKGSIMSQADLDALVQYVQLTSTILAIGDFTPDEQQSVWMILERVDVDMAPGYTVTDNTEVTMTSGGLVTINSLPWTKITGKPAFFSGAYADLTGKPTLFSGNYNDLTNKPDLSAYLPLSGGTLTGKLNAAQGSGTTGGYSFGGTEGGADTGMFSNSDGILDFYSDNVKIVTVTTNGVISTRSITLPGDPTSNLQAATKQYVDNAVSSVNGGSSFSGDYNDLLNTPAIPTNLSQLTNDAGYITTWGQADWNEQINESPSYIQNKPYIPSDVSDLTDNNNLLGGGGVSLPANASGYLTNDGAGNLAWAAGDGTFSGNYNDLTNKPTIPTSLSDFGITAGSDGQVLTLNSSLVPVWATPSNSGNPFNQDLNTTDNVTFNKVTVTGSQGIEDADGLRITNINVDGKVYVGSNLTQAPVSVLIGGAGPRNEWAFTPDGKLTLPEVGTGIGWTNTDTAPTPDTEFLYSSTISFDKNQGIVLNNAVGDGGFSWTLGKDGKLKLPANGDIVDSNGNSVLGGGSGATTLSSLTDVALEGPVEGSVLTWNDTQSHWENRSLPAVSEITNTDGINNYNVSVSPEGIVTMRTARGNLEFGAQPEEGAPQHFHIMRPAGMEGSTDLYFGDDYNYFKLPGNYGAGTLGVDIGANDGVGGAQQVWRFGTDGTLTLPAGGDIKDSTGASVLGGGSGPGLGNFVFNGSVLAMNDDAEDMSIKAPDDLYLDALGDDVFVRADDDVRLRAGVNFDEDTYSYAWNFRDSGELAFYSDASDGEHGRITMTTDSANNQRVLEIGGIDKVHITTDMEVDGNSGNNKTWKFDVDGNLTLPAGGDILDSNGNSVLGDPASPQYGYFTELVETSSSNTVNGQAVVMDSDGNSYVSFVYWNDSENRDFSGVAKYDSTGEQVWAVNLASQNPNARELDIRSLEFVTGDADPALIAMGHYYDNNTSKDVAFIFYINPATGSVGEPMVGRELVAQNGMNVKDGVAGYDGSNTYAVVVGETYEQMLTKTFTPMAGSITDKLFVSWSEFAASGVNNGEAVYYYDGPNQYGMTMNAVGVSATVAGSTDPAWAGISITVGVNQAGNYIVTGANGWGYLVNSWPVPVTLTVAGSALGGVDGPNDMTFDFDRTVFDNNSANIQAAISNIMGTPPVSGAVYCTGWGGYDWSTQVGNALTFNYHLNSQAYVARFGQTASWTKNFGGAEYDRMNSVAVDNSQNIYAVGRSWGGSRGSLVVKYDIDGNQQWAVYIDPANNTGNALMSVDLLSDGNVIAVDEDGVVTKLNSSDGSIIWQVKADNGPSWDGDFRGTATPDGDYIITNYEDDDYTQYVMRISGSDGSSVWNKRIRRTSDGNNGEVDADDDSQYIDCNATNLTITGRTDPPGGGNTTGIVYSFPINGENTDGTYGQYVITSESMNWETLSTTSIAATVINTDISVTVNSVGPTSSSTYVTTSTVTTMGGEPIVEPTVITWTNPNDNVWRIETYNGGAAVYYDGGDNDAKWFDIANHTSGNSDFRGAVIQYHAFVQNAGTIIGTIHLSNDNTQPSATHTEHLSGNSSLQLVTLWDCNYDRGQLYFKMTDGSSRNVMIQWTSTVFYGQEWND